MSPDEVQNVPARAVHSFSALLHPQKLDQLVNSWLEEDTPSFDYGGFVVGESEETAVLLCKSESVLSGVPFFDAVFQKLNCKVEWLFPESTYFSEPGAKIVARVHGHVKDILLGERVALNCITRASGISLLARRLNDIKLMQGWKGEIAGTRKTTPGFRMVEKYALLVGGCSTHRYDLSSMVMLKDNHIWVTGSVPAAVKKARKACGFSSKIEVECRSMHQAIEACQAGADVVMLDNFDPTIIESLAQSLKEQFPAVIVEASGGITMETISKFMTPSINVISMGCLTQGYKTSDFSLKILKDGHDPTNPVVTAS